MEGYVCLVPMLTKAYLYLRHEVPVTFCWKKIQIGLGYNKLGNFNLSLLAEFVCWRNFYIFFPRGRCDYYWRWSLLSIKQRPPICHHVYINLMKGPHFHWFFRKLCFLSNIDEQFFISDFQTSYNRMNRYNFLYFEGELLIHNLQLKSNSSYWFWNLQNCALADLSELEPSNGRSLVFFSFILIKRGWGYEFVAENNTAISHDAAVQIFSPSWKIFANFFFYFFQKFFVKFVINFFDSVQI